MCKAVIEANGDSVRHVLIIGLSDTVCLWSLHTYDGGVALPSLGGAVLTDVDFFRWVGVLTDEW